MPIHRANPRKKWISIVGARPQFIKLVPFCRAIEQHNRKSPSEAIEHTVIQTGQHYDKEMAELFLHQLKVTAPKYNLGVGSGSHGTQLARMLARMEPILCSMRPDWVIVYGDTNSTLAAALLSARLKLPLVHVEAGCRTGNINHPEEQNAIVTDHLSQLLFVASKSAEETLLREGIGGQDDPRSRRIVCVGDILLDALVQHSALAEQEAEFHLQEFGLESKGYHLLTLHRAENTEDLERLRGILEGVSGLDLPVLFPVHPRTRDILDEHGISLNGNLRPVQPLGYLEMLTFQKHARKILTDSGGIQREAFYLGVPCITLRERTEWVETIAGGANRLVSPSAEAIRTAVGDNQETDWRNFTPYGNGTAAQKIVSELLGKQTFHATA